MGLLLFYRISSIFGNEKIIFNVQDEREVDMVC